MACAAFATWGMKPMTHAPNQIPNPLKMDSPPRGLTVVSRQPVDLGGFECKLELYRRV